MFPPDNVELLEKMFKLREICKIAEGTFGQVYKALDLTDNSICAVKVCIYNHNEVVGKSLCKDFSMEIEIIQSLQHEHIVQFKRVVENKHSYFLVMELMQGGTLSSKLNEPISDDLAASIMKNILKAVSYIHSNQIIHRDLKPDNILLLDQNLDSCKIADFGLSFKFSQDGTFHRLLKSKCGTVLYMAPEQFSDKYYNKQIDSWSCGIIMYMLLSQGVHPLYDKYETKDQLIQKIKNPVWMFPDNFSGIACDFFKRMTAQSAIDRYSVDQALMHPWITRNFEDSIPLTYNEQINQFQRDQELINRFKFVLMLTYIQKHSTSQTLMLDDSIDVDSEQSARSQNSEQRVRVQQLVKKSLFSLKSQKNIRVTTPKFDFQLSTTKPRISSDNLTYIDDTIRPNTLRSSKSGGRISQYTNINNLKIYTNRTNKGLPPISFKPKK